MFDLTIIGGMVVDGTGTPAKKVDLGIKSEQIDAIADLSQSQAKRVINAEGLVVSPGFIDTHTHSEGALLVDPQHSYGLRQGITTELLGIDGMSYAPLSPKNYLIYRHWLGGLLGDPPKEIDMSSVTAFRSNYHKKVSINTAYLVPNGTVRLEVLGFRDLPMIGSALNKARQLVLEGLNQGAVGFTSGGGYFPGPWADTQELIELCKVVAEAGGIYMCEPRRASLNRAFRHNGIEEALEVARQTGVKLHIAHFRTSAQTAGQVDKHMSLIDKAKDDGVDCTLDIYPYPTGSTIPVSFLPDFAQEGGPDAIIECLNNTAQRKKIIQFLKETDELPVDLEAAVFSYLPKNPELEGMSLPEIASKRDKPLEDTLCDLLLEEQLKVGYWEKPPDTEVWNQINRDCMELLSRSDYMVCSDITPAGSRPHPRCYGAFPRFLGRLRRNFGLISLEQMIHRMTGRPAQRFGITKRGQIKQGYYADLVIFDPAKVDDNATYDDPCKYPTGIPFVVVNGQVAVDNEKCTGIMAGQAVP